MTGLWRFGGGAIALLCATWCVGAAPARARLLTFVQAQFDGSVQGLRSPTSVAVSPDGSHVYVTTSGDSSLVGFSRDAASGRLVFVETHFNGENGVRGLGGAASVTLSPDGKHVYVASSADNALATFGRDTATGKLNFLEAQVNGVAAVAGLGGASSLAISPEGDYLYATGRSDNAVSVFRRDAATGHLTQIEVEMNGRAGINGLAGASSVAISPDGATVYVSGRSDAAIAVFTQDSTTGLLAFEDALIEGVNGVTGLARPNAIVVGPSGAQVYVASFDQDITVFQRDTINGSLAFLQNANVLPGGPTDLAISPDGARVYVTSYVTSARSEVNVFTRKPDGTVTVAETEADGSGGVEGVNGASAVAVSPDGTSVYVTGSSDNAVAAFSTTPVCVGDCNGDGVVTVDEIVTGVSIALGTLPVSTCLPFDGNDDGQVTVDEILTAVNTALNGCGVS